MSKLIWVKNGSSWAPAKYLWVANRGSYSPAKAMWASNGDTWVQTYPGTGAVLYTASTDITIPSGVSAIDVMVIGGGGGGGSGSIGSGGGGGGGYASIHNNIAVNAGDQYSVVVGNGGAGGASGSAGAAGGDSSFSGHSLAYVGYGGGGGAGTDSSSGLPAIVNGPTGGGSWTHAPRTVVLAGFNGGTSSGTGDASSGGGGGGAGSGTSPWYQVGWYTWGWFMNDYAIWTGGINDVTTYTYTTQIYFPTSGYYQLELSADNAATIYFDSNDVLDLQAGDSGYSFQASPATATQLYIAAGAHTFSMAVTNYGGPAGGAARFLDSAGRVFWNTRDYLSINAAGPNSPGNGGNGLPLVFNSVEFNVGGGGAGGHSNIGNTGSASYGGGESGVSATGYGGGGGGGNAGGYPGGNGYQGLVAINYHT